MGALAGLLEDVPALTEILLRHVVPKNIVKLYKAEMSYDNAGGSKVMVDGYSWPRAPPVPKSRGRSRLLMASKMLITQKGDLEGQLQEIEERLMDEEDANT